MIDTNIYDCPIFEQIGQLQTMMANEHDKMVLKAVQQVGVEFDQESLIQAINSDKKNVTKKHIKKDMQIVRNAIKNCFRR